LCQWTEAEPDRPESVLLRSPRTSANLERHLPALMLDFLGKLFPAVVMAKKKQESFLIFIRDNSCYLSHCNYRNSIQYMLEAIITTIGNSMTSESYAHHFSNWAKERLDEMDATLTSIEGRLGVLHADAKKQAEKAVSEIRAPQAAARG
jgi:hypothetical protein